MVPRQKKVYDERGPGTMQRFFAIDLTKNSFASLFEPVGMYY